MFRRTFLLGAALAMGVSLLPGARATAFSGEAEPQPIRVGVQATGTAQWEMKIIKSRKLDRENGVHLILKDVAGKQAGHARNVAVVLASLVGAAKEDVGHGGPIHSRVALHQRPERNCAQVVGAHARQSTAVAAEWGSDGVADEGVALCHWGSGRMDGAVGDGAIGSPTRRCSSSTDRPCTASIRRNPSGVHSRVARSL